MIHVQGCTLACPGCFNPASHASDTGSELSIEELLHLIPVSADGVTISGGEPFLQAKELLELVMALRKHCDSIVIFSGFYLHEILNIPRGPQILLYVDVLIDGRYDPLSLANHGLRGSSNQTVHLLTNRHSYEELQERQIEITIDPKGKLTMTGFPSPALRHKMNLFSS